jgi:hypothetical protein
MKTMRLTKRSFWTVGMISYFLHVTKIEWIYQTEIPRGYYRLFLGDVSIQGQICYYNIHTVSFLATIRGVWNNVKGRTIYQLIHKLTI